jgi:hypothetical protein
MKLPAWQAEPARVQLRQSENVNYADAGAVIGAAELRGVTAGLERYHESRFRIVRGLQTGRGDLDLLGEFPVVVSQGQTTSSDNWRRRLMQMAPCECKIADIRPWRIGTHD